MAGGHRGTVVEATFVVVVCVLSGFATLLSGGCADSGQRTRPAQPGTTRKVQPALSQMSEADLLAELDKKFENPDVHYQLGALYHTSKEWAKAEYHYNIALGFDPAHRATQAGVVKLQADRGNAARSEQYARNYIAQAAGSVRELLKLGQEFSNQKLSVYALTCFKQALSMAPNSAEANKHMGFYYYDAGDKVRAKEYLTRSFELNPNQPDVAGVLGRLGVVVQVPTSASSSQPKPQTAKPPANPKK